MLELTEEELANRGPSRATLARATELMDNPGFLRLCGAFEKEIIEAARVQCVARYAGLSTDELEARGTRVGHDRYMISPEIEGALYQEEIYANPFVLPVLKSLLGNKVILNSFSVVIAFPGAGEQHVHLDHTLLFESEPTSMSLPCYAVTLAVPLIDLDKTTGGTRAWPKGKGSSDPSLWTKLTGSQLLAGNTGDCYLFDFRVCHGGTPNRGHVPRPVLYITYSRPWFYDSENFTERVPIRISEEVLDQIPEAHQSLFAATRSRNLPPKG